MNDTPSPLAQLTATLNTLQATISETLRTLHDGHDELQAEQDAADDAMETIKHTGNRNAWGSVPRPL